MDGVLQQFDLYQQRADRTLEAHYDTRIDLSRIKIPHTRHKGVYKCRVIYDVEAREIDFQPYTPRPRKMVEIVNGDGVDCPHKYADRILIGIL